MKNWLYPGIVVLIIIGVIFFIADRNHDGSSGLPNDCTREINTSSCAAISFRMYRFNMGTGLCEEVIWQGCGQAPAFTDLQECQTACIAEN